MDRNPKVIGSILTITLLMAGAVIMAASTSWLVISSPNETGADASTLAAVAALSSNDVWAVGNYKVFNQYQWDTLIEHWDGTKWSIVSSPNVPGADKNFLYAVAALSPSNVWAVGY